MDKEKTLETSNTEMLAILRAEYEQLQAEHEQLKEQLRIKELAYAKLEEKMDHLLEQIRLAKHKQFGVSSEKLCGDGMEQLSPHSTTTKSVL